MHERTPEATEHERLIRSHQQPLRGYILVIYPNHSAMEDILQETNRVLWEKRSEFREGTNFLAWARAVAQFQTMSFLKKCKSKSWLSFDSNLVRTLANSIEENDGFEQQRVANLSSCLGALSQSDRDLIRLRYEQNFPLKVISEKMGRSEGGLKQAFMRIRKVLRECVERKTIHDE